MVASPIPSLDNGSSVSKRVKRGRRATVDSVLYVLKMSKDHGGATLNKLARKRYGNDRDASTVVNKLVHCGTITERIERD